MMADYVIIGSGSAGSALAYRLGEAGMKVVVIEEGGTDAGPFINMPAALSYPMNMRRYDWGFQTEPEPHLGGPPSGHAARPGDRAGPAASTAWSMCAAMPAILTPGRRWARRAGPMPMCCPISSGWKTGTAMRADATWRGTDGPLHVTRGPRQNPLFDAFIEAGRQAGYPVTRDYNGQQQEGFGPFEATIWQGNRWSAASAYLKPALKGGNVQLYTAYARRVVIENGRAVGVEVERGGQIEVIGARREVIVAASSINTPKILMLSGIGAAAQLAEHGIAVVADRPGVGANLQDHPELYLQFAGKPADNPV